MLTSKIPPHMVTWLSAEGWTAEELSFVDNYGERYSLDIEDHKKVQSVMKIKARLDKQVRDLDRRFRGDDREYDSKNKLQRKDSPSWFGEGINRDLFK